jgi:hypothetical protein
LAVQGKLLRLSEHETISLQIKTSDKIVQHTNQYILIVQPNFCHDSDAKLTDKNLD